MATPLSRRAFVRGAAAFALAPALARCGDTPVETSFGDPRLQARPTTPTNTPTLGPQSLNLSAGRDGLLYVPTTYTPDQAAPLFVALHGAGGISSNWRSYYDRAEARGMVLLAPDSRGRTWDLILGQYGPDVEFLDFALQRTFQQVRIDPARIALGGFSDGASYALSLGVSNGDLFTHLIGHSPGFFVPSEPLVGRPRVYISHGLNDPILAFGLSRDEIVPDLRDRGYDVTFDEFVGVHEVPVDVAERALDWLVTSG